MNIGIVCHPACGGSGTVAVALARELALRGESIHLIARSRPAQLEDDEPGIRFHGVTQPEHPLLEATDGTVAMAARMAGIAQEQRLHLLHVHYAIPYAISALLAREMLRNSHPLPVVTTLHGTDVTSLENDPSYRAMTRFAIAQCDGVTAVSSWLAATAGETFGLSPPQVIPNFVNATEFRRSESSGVRDLLAGQRKCKLLLHISNFRPVKRVTDCLRIYARVRGRIPAKLIMVGDGPDAPAARELARELGMADDIHFVGMQRRVADFISAADLLLLPSESESFGLAALEAMSCGVPVLASLVGGVPEVVSDGENGRLLPVGDLKGMAAAALRDHVRGAPHRTAAPANRPAGGALLRRLRLQRVQPHRLAMPPWR